jgi:hypothetical protein
VIAANVDTVRSLRGTETLPASVALVVHEVIGTALVAILVVLPWILGAIDPEQGGPHVADPALLRRRLHQHLRDRAVGIRRREGRARALRSARRRLS